MNEVDRPAWLDVAFQERGVQRYGEGECNPRIVEYNNCTQLAGYDDKIAWCSSFANWCMAQCGLRGTESALARSWLDWGNALDEPVYGCIAVLTSEEPVDWKGHIAFYLRRDVENVYLFGGNQLGEVRELAYPLDRVLGYRWPSGCALPEESTATRIALRAATPDDVPFLLTLRKLTMTEHLQRAGEPVDEATHLQRAQSNFADACIICESEGEGESQSEQRIGLLKLSRAPDAWYVHQLQILPARQSQGIGKQVMQDVLDQASRSKIPVSLSVLHGNPARRLYERLGFRPSGETANEVVLTWQP